VSATSADESDDGPSPFDLCQYAENVNHTDSLRGGRGGSNSCPPTAGWWFDAGYTLLWTNGNPVPPLVTTNATIPPRAEAGVLGSGDTRTLLGGEHLDEGARSGVTLTLGCWLDDGQAWGLEGSWLYVGDPSDELNTGWQSLGAPVLARPFFNVGLNREDAELVAYPNVVEGQATAATSSYLQSVEALLRGSWRRGPGGRIDVLGGYRHLRFHEGLRLVEHLIARDPGGLVQIGTEIDLFDQFDAENSFHGGEIGVFTSLERGYFVFDIATKLAIGNLDRRSAVSGLTHVETPAGSQSTAAGGLLALPSNLGTYDRDTFALLPELDLKARLNLTDCLTMNVGYDLLFLTNVYRTGDQIDRSIDTSQLSPALPGVNVAAAGQTRPAPLLNGSTLRCQSLNFGVTFSY